MERFCKSNIAFIGVGEVISNVGALERLLSALFKDLACGYCQSVRDAEKAYWCRRSADISFKGGGVFL